MVKEAKTIIDLKNKEQRDAYIVPEPKNLIHLSEYERIRELLRESLIASKDYLQKVEQSGKELLVVRRHDTIMLAGVRGSGKTTFMLSLLNFIEKNTLGIIIDDNVHAEGEIESLHILDPTLIEGKTHIFLNIISMIKAKVMEKMAEQPMLSRKTNVFAREREAWRESLKQLAEGLPTIDGVGGNGFGSESWLDAEFVMNKGIQMAHAANNLESTFHQFVRQSLKFIGKKAFILCFDDIDTNFSKGWPVLEMLHKYLTTPQIITVLSGDPSLYSTLIRDRQWANFSDRLIRMEGRTISDRKSLLNMVTHQEEQYFLKLLKPERRVFLNSLYRKEQHMNACIRVEGQKLNGPLQDCYKLLLTSFGIHSGGQQASFTRFIASAPLRTQKQLLYAFDRWLIAKDDIELGNSIIDIFWSDLAEKKVDVSNLRNVPHYTVPQIVDYLTRNDVLIEGYTLTPIFSDHSINGAQFALGTLLTDRVKNDPTQIFEYWLRICLTRELGALMEGRADLKIKGPSVQDYVDYCAVTKLRTSRYVSRFSTAYIRAYLGSQTGERPSDAKVSYDKGSWHGTLPLFGFSAKGKKGYSDRIDYVLDKSDYFTKIMGYLPLSGATNHRGESLPVYSFYNLLGVLGEIILVARSAESDVAAVNEVTRAILKNSQYREYPVPCWSSGSSSGEDSGFVAGVEGSVSQEEIDKMPPEFPEAIVSWARSFSSDFIISPSVLGKIFTRFFYSTNNMDKELPKDTTVGEWMHRMVVVFLHSVILVEAMEKLNLAKVSLNLKNPIRKDNIFLDNLNKINKAKQSDTLQVSRWLLASPLWKVYLKKSFDCSPAMPDALKIMQQFLKSEDASVDNYGLGYNLYASLNKVAVKRQDVWMPVPQARRAKLNIADKLRFSVNNAECLEDLQELSKKAGISSDTLIKSTKIKLIKMLHEILVPKYDRSSINVRTAESIFDRIKDGRISKW